MQIWILCRVLLLLLYSGWLLLFREPLYSSLLLRALSSAWLLLFRVFPWVELLLFRGSLFFFGGRWFFGIDLKRRSGDGAVEVGDFVLPGARHRLQAEFKFSKRLEGGFEYAGGRGALGVDVMDGHSVVGGRRSRGGSTARDIGNLHFVSFARQGRGFFSVPL